MSDQQRIALVTGGAQGIGKGIAARLLADGWKVAIADLDADAVRETCAELATSGDVIAIPTDVSCEEQVHGCIEQVIATWGSLAALVNNAGIARAHAGPVEQLALADWNRVLAVNLTGALLMAKHAAPHLKANQGSIVNIASTRALQSEANSEAYAASKGGLVALTHALAVSLGPEVRVNCVSPGWIAVDAWQKSTRRRTPQLSAADHAQHPAGRVGTPEDVAGLVAWLLSSEAGFMTGQNLVLDGGMTRKMIYLD